MDPKAEQKVTQKIHKQTQTAPGLEAKMDPQPVYIRDTYKGCGKLKDKVALITGGDSGIGRSVAVHFAREGADVAIAYLPQEEEDAQKTCSLIKKEGRKCLCLPGDMRDESYSCDIVEKVVKEFGKLNILVNNHASQVWEEDFTKVSSEDLKEMFDINFFSFQRTTKAALKHMGEGDTIINTSSINNFKGNSQLSSYTATKGAITAWTRSIAMQLAEKKIRVNMVAPGPIWTPLIPTGIQPQKIEGFGEKTLLGRAGQPCECATCYVFLASEDASYFTGQTLHPNGGTIVNT
jgi:NAD(P)-dependent dehydrogenase (short-subunit alcohol dehydrogenase family)